ncbi:MAG: condensation domain-containing protein [Vicinamibacterales bacterium]
MASPRALRRCDVEDVFTLTPLQQGMLSYAAGGLHRFQERSVTSLRGRLNLTAFSAAWQAVVNRHPALRSAFVWKAVKVPHQVVVKRAELHIRQIDLSRLDPEARDRHLRRLFSGPPDWRLDRPPLMTLFLARLGEHRFQLVWTISHLVTDAFSFSVIIEDLLQRYRLALEGRPWDTQEGPSFREYVAWLKRQDLSPALAVWEREISSRTGSPQPPRAVPGLATSRPKTRQMVLPNDLTAALQAFSARHRTSLFVIYLGSLALVQRVLTMSRSPVIAIVTSCRSLPVKELDSMVGLVMNTLLVPVDVREQEPLGSWLAGLGDTLQRLLRFEHVPFQWLQETCSRHGQRAELAFNFLNVNRGLLGGPGFDVTGFRQVLSSSFPIGVDVTPGRQTQIDVSYEPSACDAASVDRMLQQWHEVLALIPAGERTVGTIARMAASVASAARALEVEKRRRASLPEWMM